MKYTIIRIEKKEIDIIKISKKNRIKNINILFKINRKKIKREIRKNKDNRYLFLFIFEEQ